jgi:hypothetical protein
MLRLALAIAICLTLGATCGETYARLAIPFYKLTTSLMALPYPWTVSDIDIAHDGASHSAVLRLTGDVRRHRDDPQPVATVVTRVQVGEVIQTPLVFWTAVLLWPAPNVRQRLTRIALGIPVFLGLETLTTACQLLHSMADPAAMLAGDPDPLTPWEMWSRFLEAGGRFVFQITAAVLTVAASTNLSHTFATIPGLTARARAKSQNRKIVDESTS